MLLGLAEMSSLPITTWIEGCTIKVKDEAEWQKQLADFAADDEAELASLLRDFCIAWAERSETVMDLWEQEESGDGPLQGIKALRWTLRSIEAEKGRFPVGFLGMALVLFTTHWEPAGDPKEFFESMTTIEQNLYLDVAQLKLTQLQSGALAEGQDG